MKCLNCGCENDITDTTCKFCGYKLNHEQIMRTEAIIDKVKEVSDKANNESELSSIKVIRLIKMVPLFIASMLALVCLVIGIAGTIYEKHKSKGYSETEGVLVDFEKEVSYDKDDEPEYNGIYEYVVDGQKYKGTPKKLGGMNDFKKKVKVKYNPDNPSKYVISAGWSDMCISAIVILIAAIIYVAALKVVPKVRTNKKGQINYKLLSK